MLLTNMIMDAKPLVSVIIIFLNGEEFLEEAINSVIDQTYTNWELLLVDDGSTDGSTEIALSYTKVSRGKIRYLQHEHHQNKGMSATRNLGIKHAKGEYIGFLDADDVWLSNKLSEQMAIFKKHPQCGMVYGRTKIWYSWTMNVEDQNKDHFFPLGVVPNKEIKPPGIVLLILKNKVQSPTTCNILIKKNVFEKAGFFLESFKGMFEDAAFFCKAALVANIYVSDATWAKYRQHDKSCSAVASKTNSNEKARYKFLKWFKNYLDSKKVYSAKVKITLFKEMFPYRNKVLYTFLDNAFALLRPFTRGVRFIKKQFFKTLMVIR